MKKTLMAAGAIMLCLGMLVATGADQNPMQAFYALVLLGGASGCLRMCDRMGKTSSKKLPINHKQMKQAA